MRETVAPDEHATAESPSPEMVVTVVAGPFEEVVGASTT
jgi:hypothetical protein